jgi:hypothetical protein
MRICALNPHAPEKDVPISLWEGGMCERKVEVGGRHMQRDGEGAIVVGERKDNLADSLFVVRKQRTLE